VSRLMRWCQYCLAPMTGPIDGACYNGENLLSTGEMPLKVAGSIVLGVVMDTQETLDTIKALLFDEKTLQNAKWIECLEQLSHLPHR